MRRLFLTGAMIISSTLLLAGCEQISSSSTANQPSDNMTDASLRQQVESRLDSDPQLKDADLDVDASAAKNEVTLSGTVDSEALRNKAVDLAKGARTGLRVVDKMNVNSQDVSRSSYTREQADTERARGKSAGDSIGDSLDDAWIHMKVVAQLLGNSRTPERKINVDVRDNVVTLRGTVDTAEQKAEAERVARNTEGVRNVQNQLKVSPKS